MEIDGIKGVYFAVWAPNAMRVSVVGDFNQWDGRRCQMHRMPATGIYELFVPDVKIGDIYKFELKVKGGLTYLKADPYANAAEASSGEPPESGLWMVIRGRMRTGRKGNIRVNRGLLLVSAKWMYLTGQAAEKMPLTRVLQKKRQIMPKGWGIPMWSCFR